MRAYAGGAGAVTRDLTPAIVGQLRRLGDLLLRSIEDDAFAGPGMRSLSAVAEYLRQGMADLPREEFRVLHLDGDNRLLADRVMWAGTVNRVQVHVREIIRDLMETGATAIILAHNHPFGEVDPSPEDLSVTRKLEEVCSCLDVLVQDHVIVGRRGLFSMRARGLLRSPSKGGVDGHEPPGPARQRRRRTSAGGPQADASASPSTDELDSSGRPERVARARLVARSALALRRRRERALGEQLFAEPAWDMLLDLYVRQSEGLRTTVSSACIGAAAPATTALRHLVVLEEHALVERHPAPGDARMSFVRLGQRTFDEMTALLAVDVTYE